jgi:hypothetical protein
MKIDVQVMVGGNIILSFDWVDVELTKEQADELKALLENAIEQGEHEVTLIEVCESM